MPANQSSAGSYQEWLLNSYVEQMSQTHTNTALSWRRLYLSRAKLKASSRTSALLSGFAMVAMVEISIDKDDEDKSVIPEPLLILFGVTTTLLVTVHLVALMISTCILPNIEAVSNVHSVQAVSESPHDQMRVCVEIAWVFSTGLGILLFLAEIAILCWVKFYRLSTNAAIASTVIVIPAGILFIVFSLMFYKKLMAHKYQRHSEGLKELDEMARELNSTGDGNNIV
ncbi:protein orai-2 [Aplysia californica]|uniref:Protein orai-2 n=1 Tax=Aplysia californica TaxID=6500 RepID=A0ABM0JCB0_APLCA|nr:protein orai-2 [Aplysia californica]